MAKPGPPKTPTNILAIRGSTLVSSRKDEPRPTGKAPTCPERLSSKAKVQWKYLSPALEELSLLTKLDRGAFMRYCTMLALNLEAADKIYGNDKEDGTGPIKGKMSKAEGAQWFSVFMKTSVECSRFEAKFGLTPADRAGISIPEAPPEDEDAKWFNRG